MKEINLMRESQAKTSAHFGTSFCDRFSIAILVIYSIILLYISVYYLHPLYIGDSREYLGMSISFYNHLSPDLQDVDLTLRSIIEAKNGIVLSNDFDYLQYYRSESGRYYSNHMWIYSLLNMPMFLLIHYLNFNEYKSFQITNSLLIIACLWLIVLLKPYKGWNNFWFFLLCAINPALFYIWWPHTEVFSYSFVVMAIVFALKGGYKLSVLLSAFASLQNPPIIILTIYFVFVGWKESNWDTKNLFCLLGCASFSSIYYIFYYLNYHTYSLQALIGAASIDYISSNKVLNLFFDLNCGMLPYIPLLLIIALLSLVFSLKKKDLYIASLWLVLISMATLASTTVNWNSGMLYINRYAIWMLPIVILISICGLKGLSRKKSNVILLAVFMINLSITGFCLYEHDLGSYLKFNSPSGLILVNSPNLYNPPYELFAERSIGAEIDYREYLPIIFTYDGKPRKILTDDRNLGLVEKFLGHPINTAVYEQIKKSNIGYINFENLYPKYSYDEQKIIVYNKKNIEDISLSGLTILDDHNFGTNNWYGIQNWNGIKTRWMKNNATISVYSSNNLTADLSIQVASFYRERNMTIYSGNVQEGRFVVPVMNLTPKSVPVKLKPGYNSIRFYVKEGCERPSDKHELNSNDSRCLSVAVQNMTLNGRIANLFWAQSGLDGRMS